MKKIIIFLIFLVNTSAFGAGPLILLKNEIPLSTVISSFDVINPMMPETELKIQISNYNNSTKIEALTNKAEEYQEYIKYTLNNPFFEDGKKKLELYAFQKIKLSVIESQDSVRDVELTDFGADLWLLVDSATKKTLKSKVQFFYKERLVAEGVVDANSTIKITDDLSGKIRNGKINALKVTRNLLSTAKRSLDVQIQFLQAGKELTQNLNISLLNIKQTPIVKEYPALDEELDEELENEGSENETTTHNS